MLYEMLGKYQSLNCPYEFDNLKLAEPNALRYLKCLAANPSYGFEWRGSFVASLIHTIYPHPVAVWMLTASCCCWECTIPEGPPVKPPGTVEVNNLLSP